VRKASRAHDSRMPAGDPGGANLVVVKGRQRRHAAYGCPQHFSRGACRNSVCIRQDKIETMVFETLRDKFLTPEVLALIMTEFVAGLKDATDTRKQNRDHFEARIKELELELQNLVDAIAKGKAPVSILLDSIHQREAELRRLKIAAKKQSKEQPEISPDGFVDFARSRLLEICELMKIDVVKAKVELGKHLSEIVMRPDLKPTPTILTDGGIGLVSTLKPCFRNT
jgi:site-specific DNA recombinase